MKQETKQCHANRRDVDTHYEEQWEKYSEKEVIERVKNLSPVLDAIISPLIFEPGFKILDLGCGPAILSLKISESRGQVEDVVTVGIDISNQALRLGNKVSRLKSLENKIKLIKGDCEALPFKNNIFDGVISNATINLLLDKKNGFREIARVIKKKGLIVIGDCTAGEGKKYCREDDDELWSACISGAPTKNEFHRLAHDAGLEMMKTYDLSRDVTKLVEKELWNWPEFVQYEMDYFVFVLKKP